MSEKVGPYWDSIRELVDAAPPLTAEQASQIREVLGSAIRSPRDTAS
jgi:hypothetical protein